MLTEQLFSNLPLYARMLDDSGILQHICDAFQPVLDDCRNRLDRREFYFDPTIAPVDFLDYLANFSGLSVHDGEYLGTGLNPNWPAAWKRQVILRAPAYWGQKGTEWGIREAISLWLGWDGHSDNLNIFQPFGVEAGQPPAWWGYNTPYCADINQTLLERQRLGGGDYANQSLIQGTTLHEPGHGLYYEPWPDRRLLADPIQAEQSTGSGLAPQRPWMIFDLNYSDWFRILPDLWKLNPQIWNSLANPEIVAMLLNRLRQPIVLESAGQAEYLIEEELVIDGFLYPYQWPYRAGLVTTTTTTTTEEVTFGVTPGFGYSNCWTSPYTPLPPNLWWFAKTLTTTISTTTTTEETSPCRLGLLGDVQVGTEEKVVGYVPAVPPNQLVLKYDGWAVPSIDVSAGTFDLSGVPGIDLSGVPGIDFSGDSAFPMTKPDYCIWEEPIYIARYISVWGQGWQWFDSGIPEVPGTIETVPIIKAFPFCNLWASWSTRTIEQIIIHRTPIPETDLNLFETYPMLASMSQAENWRLLVETGQGYMLLKPVTIFWTSDRDTPGTLTERSQSFDSKSTNNLYLEFGLTREPDVQIVSTNLLLEGKSIQAMTYPLDLPMPSGTNVVLQYLAPVRYQSQADIESFSALQLLEQLKAAIVAMEATFEDETLLAQTIREQLAMIDIIPLPPLDSTTDPVQALADMLTRTNQDLEAVATAINSVTNTRLIFPVLLTNGTISTDGETYESVFVVETNVGSPDFSIGQIRQHTAPYADIPRPEIEVVGVDQVRFTFKTLEPIGDGVLEAWIIVNSLSQVL